MDKVTFIELALELDLPTLLHMCQTSKILNETICKSNYFWKRRLEKDYPFTRNKFSNDANFKLIYKNLGEQIEYKLIDSNTIQRNDDGKRGMFEKGIFGFGEFPKGTKMWLAVNPNSYSDDISLTKGAAVKFIMKSIKENLHEDYFGIRRDNFISFLGKSPEEYFGGAYENVLENFKNELETSLTISYPSTEALEREENDIYEIREVTLN